MTPAENNGWPGHVDLIRKVQREAAMELRSCRRDLLAQLRACCRYFECGEQADITHEELIDYLGISESCVLNQADYSDAEAQLLMDSLRLIRYDREGRPYPPAELPQPPSQAPPLVQTDLKF